MKSDATTAEESQWLRDAFVARSRDAVPTEECPPAERLWSAARGEQRDGVRELVEHLATCGACAEAWRLARELEPAEESEADAAPARSWWRQPAWHAIAAAAIVALVVGFGWRPTDGPAETFRGGDSPQIQRFPDKGGQLDRRDPWLRWPGAEDATYDLVVMTDDLSQTLVDVEDLEEAEYRIPDAALHDLPEGARLRWRVEVETPQGTDLLSPYWFELRGSP